MKAKTMTLIKTANIATAVVIPKKFILELGWKNGQKVNVILRKDSITVEKL